MVRLGPLIWLAPSATSASRILPALRDVAEADGQLVRRGIADELRRLVVSIAIFGIEVDVAGLDVAVGDPGRASAPREPAAIRVAAC